MTFFICCSLIKQVRKDIKIILSHCCRQDTNAVKDSSSALKNDKVTGKLTSPG
jgi:hypothetical protein